MPQVKPPSFEALYSDYADQIYRYCFRLTGNPADAEDLAQDVFVLAYQNLSRFEGRSSPSTWLYRIALRRWYRLRSTHRPSTVPLDEEHTANDASSPASGLRPPMSGDPAPQVLQRLTLDDALAALSEPLREAFVLVKAEGLTYREAAEVLGAPQGTIQSRVHDASIRLRSLLQEGGPQACSGSEPGQKPGTARFCTTMEAIPHEV